jgi:hypothetical protein
VPHPLAFFLAKGWDSKKMPRAFAFSLHWFCHNRSGRENRRVEVEERIEGRTHAEPGAPEQFGFVLNTSGNQNGPFGPFTFAGWSQYPYYFQ